MNMPFSVTQLRVALLIVNFGCTALIGRQAYGVIFTKPAMETVTAIAPIPEGSVGTTVDTGLVIRVKSLGRKFQPAVPRPVEPPPDPAGGPKSQEMVDVQEGALPPGVLDTGWKFSQVIITPDPAGCYATLQKKDPNAAAGIAGAGVGPKKAGLPRLTNKVTVQAKSKGAKALTGGIPTAGDKKVVRPKDHWVDVDAGIDVWIVEITRDKLTYEDANLPGRLFALRIEKEPYVTRAADGALKIEGQQEEPDPNAPPPVKPLFFHFTPPDRDKEFENRRLTKVQAGTGLITVPGATGPTAPGASGLAAPGARGGKPLSTAESLKQLKDFEKTVKGLEQNEKFLKGTTPAQREQLKGLLGGKK